nr:protein B0416.6 [imported] - Caenorhabditis elegans [Caenorhabditis elegans]
MHAVTKIFIIFIFVFILWTLYVENDITNRTRNTDNIDDLLESANRLERLLKFEAKKIAALAEDVHKIRANRKGKHVIMEEMVSQDLKQWKDPIPVLVFSCNRAMAVRDHVEKLIRYRPSQEKFPIIVTQDCDNENVKNEVKKFGDKVEYIKHLAGDKANITIPPSHRQYTAYYRIARHYKLALNHVFVDKGYSSVIITEGKTISTFRQTSSRTSQQENIDMTAASTLYRSDFFAGLGWMMSSKTWHELEPIWPVGFWDDWMRDPARRKDRQCIRPEISRTGMMSYGKEGASKGQFFSKHLAKIKVNDKYINFGKIDLDYLLPANFAKKTNLEVMKEAVELSIDNVASFVLSSENKGKSVRVMYDGNIDYIRKADKLHIMHDFKAGVPRTAYDGIVTCFINGIRIYLVPDRTKVSAYNPDWSVPPSFGE